MRLVGRGRNLVPLTRMRPFSNSPADIDHTQAKYLKEQCILVDLEDNVVGAESKKTCHLMENIDRGMLHRAFSVLLFNSQQQLLLQQRSSAKITFPLHWTNTCCSHPLHTANELEARDHAGVKRAVQRKLDHELGISSTEVPLDRLEVLTRIHYKAPSDHVWGEHEIDYIVSVQANVSLRPNANEVKECKYVDQQELRDMVDLAKRGHLLLTPWFRMLTGSYLFKWWDSLGDLSSFRDSKIHTMNQ